MQSGETATIDLGLADVDTNSADYVNFVAAVNAAIVGRSDLSFDGTTLTHTGNGSPMADVVIDLTAIDDVLIEGVEDYTVSISNPGSTTGSAVNTGGTTSVTTSIIDNDIGVWSLTGDPTVAEGGAASYTLSLAGILQFGETATIDLGLSELTTNSADHASFVAAINAAVAGRSDLAFDGTTLTYVGDGMGQMADLIFDLDAIDDSLVEGSEDWQIAIGNPGSTTGSDIQTSAATSVTTTVIDDDVAIWSITGDAAVVEGADAKYVVNLAGTLQAGETATIDLNIGNLTATAPDYGNFANAVNDAIANYTGPGTLAFDGTTLTFTSDGNPMGDLCIEVEAVDDALIEGNEDFQVSIANPRTTTGSDVATVNPTIVVTTIGDNDFAAWSLTGDAVVVEGAAANYTLALGGTLQAGQTATIDLTFSDIDTSSSDYTNFVAAVNAAIASRSDLAFDGTTLTYTGDGNPMMDLIISLPTVDDVLTESTEQYSIAAGNPGSTTGSSIGGTGQVTTSITDNDALLWAINGSSSVDEGGTAQYKISLSGALQTGEQASIQLSIQDLDTGSADYSGFLVAIQTAVAGRSDLSFDPGTGVLTVTGTGAPMADLCVDLSAVDDSLVEGSERFQVIISNPSSVGGLLTGVDAAQSLVTTTINDTIGDGGPTEQAIWSLGVDQTVPEGSPGAYVLSLSGVLQAGETVTVDLGLSDLDTTSTDYASFDAAVASAVAAYAGPGSVSWDGTTLAFTSDGTGAMSPLNISLDTINDAFAEGAEDFLISLNNANSTTGVSTAIDATADDVVTTIDDTLGAGADDVIWSIVGSTSVDEGGVASYTVSLAGALGAGEVVSVELGPGDLDTTSADYASFDAAVTAAVSAYNTGSGQGSLTWDGTTLTFTAANDGDVFGGIQIDLMAVDDAFLEGPERYEVTLSNSTSISGLATGIDPNLNVVVTTINDTDGDGGPAEFGPEWFLAGDTSVSEGNSASYTVGLTGNLQAGEVTSVQFALADIETLPGDYAGFGTAVANAVAAYNADPTSTGSLAWNGLTLTFTSDGTGPMSGLDIDLATVQDAVVEGDERFNLLLSNAGSTTGLNPTVSVTQGIVTTAILDNDAAQWTIVGDPTVPEGSFAQYTVALDGVLQSGETATIDLGLTNVDTTSADYDSFVNAVNAAIAGRTDLSFDGTTLTFTSDGTPMADLIIGLEAIDDVLVEGTEGYVVSISNPASTTGSDVVAGTTFVATDIIDDDTAIWSLTGDTNTAEGNNAQYTLSLNGTLQAGETVSVQIDLADIDTDSGDYGNFVTAVNAAIASNPGVSFDPITGVITYTAAADGSLPDILIELPINSDGVSEAPEDFNIELTNPASTSGLTPTIDPAATDVTTTINGSPVLQPDFGFTNINTTFVGNVLANDSDPDGDLLTVTMVNGQPVSSPIVTGNGTVVMNPDGTFTFTPGPGFFGVETFTYTVVDSAGNTETSTVEITVTNAEFGVAKAASDAVPVGENFDVTFTLVVENLGNVPLSNLTLTDDVAAMFGDALVAVSAPTLQNFVGSGSAPTLNSNWTSNTAQNILAGGVLEVGASFEVSFTVTIDPDAGGVSQPLQNQAEVSGQGINPDGSPMVDSNGNPLFVSDLSDDGSDPAGENGSDNNDGLFGNDATPLLIADLGIAKSIVGEPELLFSGNYVVTYQVVVENVGTVTLANLSLQEDLSTQFGSAFVGASGLSLVFNPTSLDSSIAVDSAFDGASSIELLSPGNQNTLVPGDSFIIQFAVEIDPLAVTTSVENQISGSGGAVDTNGNPILDSNGDPIVGMDLSDSGSDPGSTNPNDPNDSGSSSDSTVFVPPPLPLGEISGIVFVDTNNNGVRDPGEDGIEGVQITLEGTDTYGDPVSIVVTTDTNGQYLFTDLNAGIYRLIEQQPAEFNDGTDNGEAGWIVGNDEFSNIVLNWGQTFANSSFGERLTGTSGFPPTFQPLAPIFVSNIGSLLDAFVSSSSPIYSGVAIGSNANPLSLVSGRPIAGGYSIENAGGNLVEVELPVEQDVIEEEQVVGQLVDEEYGFDGEEAAVLEEAVPGEEEAALPNEAALDYPPEPRFLRGSFLKRMANWLSR